MYKLINTLEGELQSVQIIGTNKTIPFDNANTDYQEYLQFLADGGVVEPADTPEEAD